MKKSYHSKIVPALEAAITRRISFALGSRRAVVAAAVVVVACLLDPDVARYKNASQQAHAALAAAQEVYPDLCLSDVGSAAPGSVAVTDYPEWCFAP